MNDNAYKRAYPIDTDITQGQFPPEGGLTKREMFAVMAMQGILSSGSDAAAGNVTRWAVEYADELLKALEETK
jgi:hypothetical protein